MCIFSVSFFYFIIPQPNTILYIFHTLMAPYTFWLAFKTAKAIWRHERMKYICGTGPRTRNKIKTK